MSRKIRLIAAFEFDYSFEKSQLEPDLEGVPGSELPTDQAMQELILRLEQVLRPSFAPLRVELEPGTGMDEFDEEEDLDLGWRPR